MDTMSIKDIWLVAIPEISLSILFGLLLIHREVFAVKNRSILGIIRFVVSVIIVLMINYYSRIYINSVILIIYCTAFAYSLVFMCIWKRNIRQSILVGLLITYLIMGAEFITLPLMSLLIQKFETLSIFSIRFLLSIPSRIINVIVILGLVYLNISVECYLFNKKWKLLKIQEKTTTLFLLILFTIIILMAANNSDMFVKLNQNGIDTTFINSNLQYSFYGIIFFMIISVIFFYIITKYYEYRNIALKTPEELLTDIAQISSPEKLNQYIKILSNNFILKGGEKE